MRNNALELFIERTRATWGPLSTELAASCHNYLQALMLAPVTEPWLAALQQEAPLSKELYSDPAHGFVLLAHTEHAGVYRPPHDHGRSWVIYAVQQGEIAMGTYARIEDAHGGVRLVKRDETLLRAGDAKLFLPGDIHDTRCVAGPALEFRFTERDLKHEDLVEHRVTRYVEQNGVWTLGPA
jgi:hypothetical protein